MWGAALLKIIPSVAGWVRGKAKQGAEKTKAQIKRQAAIADGWAPQLLIVFWFYPAVANYIPPLRASASQGFELLTSSPEWYWVLLMSITTAVLGLKKMERRR